MSPFNQVLWALDNGIDDRSFERLCVDLLGRESYGKIMPVGGMKDHGRDAEIRLWRGASGAHMTTFFQFSLEDRWESKLKREAKKIAGYGHSISELVFVTSHTVTGTKQDRLKKEAQTQYGWNLTFYPREWLRHRLEEQHQDLAEKYLGLKLPQTPPHIEFLLTRGGINDEMAQTVFRDISPELMKAKLLAKAKADVSNVDTWQSLAKVEYYLRNYEAALRAVNKALALRPSDINSRLLRGAILAEHGIQGRSRALLLQAKEIFAEAAAKRGRAIDHYNFANVLGPLSELDLAEKHYLICLKKQPDFAHAWKNLGSLLFQKAQHDREMQCYEKALQLKPNLVEAHLCKGITLLRIFNNPDEALQCFERAYQLDPDLDRKRSHLRFWIGKALEVKGDLETALQTVEIALLDNPDDRYLSRLKATVLSKLWRLNAQHENAALEFFKFRAKTIRYDYASLLELILLFRKRGTPDEAWPFLNENLARRPYSILPIRDKAGVTLQDFEIGLQNASTYVKYQNCCRFEDHLARLQNSGLRPDWKALESLQYVMMIPFGIACSRLTALPEADRKSDIPSILKYLWSYIGRLMVAYGVSWLASSKPLAKEEQVRLISFGVVSLPEVALAEASRHIGFIAGRLGTKIDNDDLLAKAKVNEFYSEIGLAIFDAACAEWQFMRKDGDAPKTPE
jgi:tetratricopeptide (TPR) repeat protein